MNFDEFIKKYEGKFVEYHSYGTGAQNQCVDLANAYITEVLGLKAIIGTNAQDFPSKAGNDYDWIVNTPKGLPLKGDIMIFRSADGVGHISIFIEGNLNLFTSFDQNYPTGSPCKKVRHNYRNVIGWLHPKKENMDTIPVPKNDFEKLVQKSSNYDAVCEALSYPKDTGLDTIKNAINGLKGLNTSLAKAQEEIKNREEQVSRLNTEIANLTTLLRKTEITLENQVKETQKLTTVYKTQLLEKQDLIDSIAKKLGEAKIKIAELEAKRDFTTLLKVKKFELIKWK